MITHYFLLKMCFGMLTELGLLDTIRTALKQSNSSLAQLVERRTVNPQVAGSSPAGGAKIHKRPHHLMRPFYFGLCDLVLTARTNHNK